MGKKIKTKNQGSVLIYVLLIINLLITITFILTAIFAIKTRIAFDFPNSVAAFYAADSAIEWRIYNEFKDPDATSPTFSNGATFSITTQPGLLPIRAIGTFRGVSRAIEVSF